MQVFGIVSNLYAAFSDKGFLESLWHRPFTLEPVMIIKQFGCLFAAHGNGLHKWHFKLQDIFVPFPESLKKMRVSVEEEVNDVAHGNFLVIS
ncbi:MAG TPA: hypothetical protein VGB50_00155 [Flavobacterium sp.]